MVFIKRVHGRGNTMAREGTRLIFRARSCPWDPSILLEEIKLEYYILEIVEPVEGVTTPHLAALEVELPRSVVT